MRRFPRRSAVRSTPRRAAARLCWLASAAAVLAPAAASAQVAETTLIQQSIPTDFDRGRNVSVLERSRPDYDPIGIPVGSFLVFPRIEVGAGATSNVFVTDDNKEGSAFLYTSPSVRADSNWSRHQVSIRGAGQLRGYINHSRRNEDAANLGVLGRLDVGNFSNITGEAQFARQFETAFSGEVNSQLAVLSHYNRAFGSLRSEYRAGRVRLLGVVDYTNYTFERIDIGDDRPKIDQSNRDRALTRGTAQAEYALSPSISIYGQLQYSNINYDEPLAFGIDNRDSDGVRIIGGVNFDVAAKARGSLGLGYIRRNFDSPLYNDISGASVEARLEVFPSELTTFTLLARRVIEDSNIGTTNAFFDNRVTARVDHELLRNLLLNVTGEYSHQDYIDSSFSADIYRVGGGARYLVSRRLGIEGNVTHTGRTNDGSLVGQRFNETRGQIGVVLQR